MTLDDFPEGPSEEAIAKRAYELYLQRGSAPGYELDDWLAAKAELTAAAASSASIEPAAPPLPSRESESESNDSRRNGRERNSGRRVARASQGQ